MVLRIKQETVTGPTPPGTGVIQPAFFEQESKSLSPTILLFPLSSVTLLIPSDEIRFPNRHKNSIRPA